jgi:hypothetical protein
MTENCELDSYFFRPRAATNLVRDRILDLLLSEIEYNISGVFFANLLVNSTLVWIP